VQGAGKPPTTVDKRHHVRFTLDGRSLHVHVRPSSNARDAFDNRQIDATCSTTLTPSPSTRVVASLVWPLGANDVTFDFDRDVSGQVKWCLLEYQGKDLAYATFGPLPGALAVGLRVDEKGGVPIEGAQHYFRVRDARGKVVVRLRAATHFTRLLRPGRYTLATFHRLCDGNCDNLDRPEGYAKKRFRIRSSRRTRLRVTVNYTRGTRISVVR
jgi:hypothetical protein